MSWEQKRDREAEEHSFRSGTPHYKMGVGHFKAGYDKGRASVVSELGAVTRVLKKMDCECGFDEQNGEGYQGGTCYRCEALALLDKLGVK